MRLLLCLAVFASLAPASLAETIVVRGSAIAAAPLIAAAPKLKSLGIELKVDTEQNTSTAIAALGTPGTDIALTTRAVTTEERASFPQLRLEVAPLAYQVLALIVSRDVWISGVRALTREQLQQIYEGELTNWKQLGGADQPIKFLNPEAGHGVWETFVTWLYGDTRKADPGEKFERVGTGEETRNVVEFNAGALSLVSPLRIDQNGTFGLAIKTEKGDLLQPTLEAARAGTYPLSRRFDIVTPNRPHGEVLKVIEFMQGKEGQQILRQNDLVPAEGR